MRWRPFAIEFPSVTDFERDFPSLCFALATGVGKTRLMGAFIAYLQSGMEHPPLFCARTESDHLQQADRRLHARLAEVCLPGAVRLCDGAAGDHHRRQLRERARHPRRRSVRTRPASISISSTSRKSTPRFAATESPRIKRLSEYIGESYFEYLSKLDDLVLLMDESHRYRGKAGMRAINELKPILGLELTATPQIEAGSRTTDFKNVIYSYPLASALKDGFVKEPAVATRENFRGRELRRGRTGAAQAGRRHPSS